MATVNKDFKIKSGLIVEGLQGTINGETILTENAGDQYILDLIGGETLVKSVSNEFDVSGAGALSLDRAVVDAYYDAAGSAATAQGNAEDYADGLAGNYDAAGSAAAVASDLTDHENATVAHGATGAVVGTTNTQTLTNKTIGDTLNFTGAGAMTINSDSHIVLTPAGGSSVKWGADILATQGYADQAEADAISTSETYTDTAITNLNLGTTYDAIGSAAQALADANSYTDTEIADLVGAAPALLDTLNELAAAIADNPNYATDAAAAVAGRVAKSGDTMTGDLVLPGAPTLDLHAATKGYVDQAETDAVTSANSYTDGRETAITTAYQNYANTAESDAVTTANSYTDGEITTALSTAQGYADTAESDANSYTDGEITDALVTAQGYASTAQGNAQTFATNAINGLDTDDIEEGATNLYFTNQRAIDAVGGTIEDQIDLIDTDAIEEGATNLYFTDVRAKASAAALLTGATKTNITITGNGAGLTITAENGVADSTTTDLAEGTNKYFTDARARAAVDGTTRSFTAVEVNSVAKQVAATVSCPVAGINQAYGFDPEVYRSAEFLVKVAYGNHTEISKVLLTLDINDNIAMTEYGIVGTNGSASSISADISGGEVRLLATTTNNNSTVTVMGTLLV